MMSQILLIIKLVCLNQIDSSKKDKEQVDEPRDEEKASPSTNNEELSKSWNVVHGHPKELIINEIEHGVHTQSKTQEHLQQHDISLTN